MKATQENLKFMQLFAKCFEINTESPDNVDLYLPFRTRACGRDACKELIKYLKERFPDKAEDFFGNSETGVMNCLEINRVFLKINKTL